MSLSSTTDRVSYAGDGSTIQFAFGYKLMADADLVVIVKTNSTGAESTKVLNTDYTILGTLTSGIYETGVTVQMTSAPIVGETVIIYRDKSAIQELELLENGPLPALNLEKQLDKITMMVQRVKNKLARSIGLKEGFTATFDPTLPGVMTNSAAITTKSDGSGLEYTALSDIFAGSGLSTSTYTADRALKTNGSGVVTASVVTSTEQDYLSGVTSALLGKDQSGTLKNKTLDNTNTITVKDANFTIQDDLDTTKQLKLQLSGLTTGTTRTMSPPDFDFTPMALSGTQTVTGAKTFQDLAVTTNKLDLQSGQIKFPATQSASSDANTLDDYEEGTWTASFVCGTSGTATINTSSDLGSYTKIGRMVTCIGYFTVSSVSSPTGTFSIAGLPFTNSSGSENSSRAAISVYAAGLAAGATTSIHGYIAAGATSVLVEKFAAGATSDLATAVQAGTAFGVKIVYFV